MKIAVLVGSPRRERGLTHIVATELAEAAWAAGADADVAYLADYDLSYCTHCCNTCFADGFCRQDDGANRLNEHVHEADAVVVAYPVYVWLHNGLTAAFFDKYRRAGDLTRRENGKPALGIAVAGNSGTGLYSSLKGVYSWMCTMRFQPFDPIPVTKFNYQAALRLASSAGYRLAHAHREPFTGSAETFVAYDRLPLMGMGRVDEFRRLAEMALENAVEELGHTAGDEAELGEIRELLASADLAAGHGDPTARARAVMDAYAAASALWRRSAWPWY